ncbi:MAG: hypothetical protein ACYC7E_12240, partial [Armatimonadota bacterium]
VARLGEMLDRPPRRIVVEATLLTSTLTDISAAGMSLQARGAPLSVGAKGAGQPADFSIRYAKGNVKAAVESLIAHEQGTVTQTWSLSVLEGGRAAVSLPEVDFPLQMMEVNSPIVNRDRSITLRLITIVTDEGLQVVTPFLRLRNGETLLVGRMSNADETTERTTPTDEAERTHLTEMLLFVTAYVVP